MGENEEKNENLEQLDACVEAEALAMLAEPVYDLNGQLGLFKEFQPQGQKRAKTPQGLSWQEELLAQYLARGRSKTQAYLLSHKNCKTENMKTVYPRACRLAKQDKIVTRVEQIKQCLAGEGLMSTMEYALRMTKWARRWDKAGFDALVKVGQMMGKFDEGKSELGTAQQPLVVTWGASAEQKAQGADNAPETHAAVQEAAGPDKDAQAAEGGQ